MFLPYSIANVLRRFFAMLIFAFSLTSCSDLEEKPLTEEEKQKLMGSLLTQVQVNLAFVAGNDYGVFSALLAQQISGVSGKSLRVDQYGITPFDTDPTWIAFYSGVLNLSRDIKELAVETGQKKYEAMAHTLQAHTVGMITDVWGDVPFSQTFIEHQDNVFFPTYDSQQDIYLYIFTLLNEAEVLFNDAGSFFFPGQEDLFFGGDVNQWKAYVNYLRMRYQLNLSGRMGYAQADAMMDESMFFQPGEALRVNFGEQEFFSNPLFGYLSQNANNLRAGETLVNLMEDNDPRLSVFFKPNGEGIIAGARAGTGDGNASRLGDFISTEGASVTLASYTEQKFMKAEIHFQMGRTALAQQAFEQAMESSLRDFGVYDAQWLDSFLNNQSLDLQTIMEQKYIALFMQPQVWTDWRRNGYPVLQPAAENHTGDLIPRRFPYPQNEYEYNRNNIPGNFEIWEGVWWDVNQE